MITINNKYNIKVILEYILYFISFTIFIDRSPITINGSYVRLYQIISIFFIIGIAYLIITKQFNLRLDGFSKIIMLWFFALVISGIKTEFIAAYIKAIIGQLYLLIFAFSIYIYIINSERIILKKVYRAFINGLMFGVMVGVIQFLVYVFSGINIGVTHMYLGLARPIGLMRETNWYSLVCLLASIPMMVHVFTGKYFMDKKRDLAYFILSIVAMFLSMTRTAFLAFAIIYIIVFILLRFNKMMLKFATFVMGFAIVIIIVMAVINPELVDGYVDRLNPFKTIETDQGAFNSRTATLELSIDKFKEHPIIGNGAGTIGQLANLPSIREQYAGGGELNTINAGPNILVNLFYESGLIGAFIFIFAFYLLGKKLLNQYNRKKYEVYNVICISMLMGIIIFSMFNNSIRFGVFWFIIAVVEANLYSDYCELEN